MKRKQAFITCLKEERVRAKKSFDFSFTSRRGDLKVRIFTFICTWFELYAQLIITIAFHYPRNMLRIQILVEKLRAQVTVID